MDKTMMKLILALVYVALVPFLLAGERISAPRQKAYTTSKEQRSALRTVLSRTATIVLERHEKPALVIQDRRKIERFTSAMQFDRQEPYCMCMHISDVLFIDDMGKTNIVNIGEGLKFRGPWAKNVVDEQSQGVPTPELLELYWSYRRARIAKDVQQPAEELSPDAARQTKP